MSFEHIQHIRELTGAGVVDVKNALAEAGGDVIGAVEILRKRGEATALKKGAREAKEGTIAAYIHLNKIGVMVELNCETDFVARTEEFRTLAKEIAMQVAAMNPRYVRPEDIPEETLAKEKEIVSAGIDAGKSKQVQERIIAGKMEKFFSESCLMRQIYFRDETKTIQDVVTEAIGKLGENIQIRRIIRWSLDDPR